MVSRTVVLTCEHATNFVPKEYLQYFSNDQNLLETHAGIDLGALQIAKSISLLLKCRLIEAQVTRLLIDCNRSLKHTTCFSKITKNLANDIKQKLIMKFYLPYRNEVENYIRQKISNHSEVLHLSIHSFTPILNNTKRLTDIGLLYDPRRGREKKFAQDLLFSMSNLTKLKIRRNYPYMGISDGVTTSLRKIFSNEEYIGMEIEFNQDLVTSKIGCERLAEIVAQSLENIF